MAHVIPQVQGFARSAAPGSVRFMRGDVTVYVTQHGRTAPFGCWQAEWRGVDSLTLDNMAEDGHETAARCRAAIDAEVDALRAAIGEWPTEWAEFILA